MKTSIHWLVLIAIGSYVIIALLVSGIENSFTDLSHIINAGIGFGLGIVCIGVGLFKYIEKQRTT